MREENYKRVFEELNTAKCSINFWNYIYKKRFNLFTPLEENVYVAVIKAQMFFHKSALI